MVKNKFKKLILLYYVQLFLCCSWWYFSLMVWVGVIRIDLDFNNRRVDA